MHESHSKVAATAVLSVVVVSFNDAALLADCLRALISQPGSGQIEIHVISKEEHDVLSAGEQFQQIHWHLVPQATTIPEMRSLGILESKADLLALIEDDCLVGPQWLQAILSAHRAGHVVVGGAIEPGNYTSGLDWGVFYCEFGRFMLPFSGPVNALPGNNVSYRSESLDPALIKHGFYEVFIHERWRNSGVELYAAKDMAVKNNNSWRFSNCTVIPFHHGRAYAGQRFGTRFGVKRLFYVMLAILLPIVKSYRTFREVRSRRRRGLPLVKALPWILVFHGCWSMGELAGYLAGPGNSIGKWS